MRRSAAAKEPGLTERQVELMISEVKSLQKGAFAGWTANPVFGALLLPFGGAGALWLVDLLVQFGL